eukprot:11976225-Alexandrium_andersonii.AAC.1
MSASLVGSEMCIRDSGPSPCAWLEASQSGGRAQEFGRVLSALSTVPVSYTHLTLPTICSV